MPEPDLDAEPEVFVPVWSAQRTLSSILVGVPGILLSSVFLGLLATILFNDTSVSLAVIGGVAAVTFIARVSWWLHSSKREVVVSEHRLAVRRGGKVTAHFLWAETASVDLLRGDSMVRLVFDFMSSDADFPCIQPISRDRWAVDPRSPGLLAILPSEYRRLAAALDEQCQLRSIPFTAE
jgi:hypothetical protein